METWLGVLGILVAYLLGSAPSAYILVRLVKGADIRALGTGNVGALNTYQQLGVAGAVAVLIVDVSKGAVAVLLPDWVGAPTWASYASAFAVVAGHTWPVFLRFRGGKGAATALGVGLALALPLAAIALIPVAIATLVLRNVVIGVAIGFVLFNVLTVATGESWALVGTCLAVTLMVVANYLTRTLREMLSAVRQRKWHSILYRE